MGIKLGNLPSVEQEIRGKLLEQINYWENRADSKLDIVKEIVSDLKTMLKKYL